MFPEVSKCFDGFSEVLWVYFGEIWYLRRIMDGAFYISVILPLKLEWEPCYSLPAGMNGGDVTSGTQAKGSVKVGDRVKVQFAGKVYSGVVSKVGVKPETDPSKIKSIIGVEEGLEPVLEEELELWRQVAGYYLCSIGEVYKAAYPIGKINLEEARAAALEKARRSREKLLDNMRARIAKTEERLNKKLESAARAKEGTKTRIRNTEDAERIKQELEAAREALKQAEALYERGAASSGKATCSGAANAAKQSDDLPWAKIDLSPAQEKAYKSVREGFASGKPVLLNGVTGSGKTEIYIKLAQETLKSGKNVLYLVPEIALSRQLEERLQIHFGDRLLTFHSGETAASKRNTAETIRALKGSDRNYIVLGTRSSLFLPHHTLGLIIVDEEHDSSYKQDSPAPRYNGRDTALMLSVIQKCRIILGSATPSLEELYNCRYGKHHLAELQERYHGSQESDIEIIDTKAERRKRGMQGNFSRKLIDHIQHTLGKGGQVMILRSRRSWSPALQCEECGEIPKCPHCNVSLSFHKYGQEGSMTCHYCGHKAVFTGRCDKCGGALKSLGAGTQRIEEEAAALFPSARIARLDSDTAQSKTFETKVIKDFSKGEIDILIGTQMLSKGFDFSNLHLVAVISADTLLGLQDFRADEKALQLLEQFRGRSGRRGEKGLFVIQTSQPEHPIYQRIQRNEAIHFNDSLLLERETFNFPPYSRIIEIDIRDRYADRAERMAGRLADALTKRFGMTLSGPYTPAVDKIADEYIRAMRISLKKDRNLVSGKKDIMDIVQKFEKANKYSGHITLNVDPS